MTEQEIEACWRDRRNYKGGFYYCRADPRPIVPKRIKWMGWTINAARPSAIPALLVLFAILIVPAVVVKSTGAGMAAQWLTLAASIIAVCLLCGFFSSPKRWSS
ncbi:MAG: DUF5808 domain-containing protein [Limisphaerales bacterium]